MYKVVNVHRKGSIFYVIEELKLLAMKIMVVQSQKMERVKRRADERRERKNKAVNKMEHAERRGARDRKQAAETRTCSITAKVAASRSRFFVTAHCS